MMKRVLDELAALRGVHSVGATQRLPLRGQGWSMGLRLLNAPADAPTPRFRIVTGNYFASLGIPLRRGRVFDATDVAADSIASIIVNEALVKIYFPNVEPDRPGMLGGFGKPERIVGVVGDVAEGTLTERMLAGALLPRRADLVRARTAQSIVVRMARAERRRSRGHAMRGDIIARVAPSVAVQEVTTMQRVLDTAVGPARDVMKLLGVLTSVALLLGAIGIYGVISQFVARRHRDWSIRVALGLSPASVVASDRPPRRRARRHRDSSLELRRRLLSAQLLSAFLFGVSSHDPFALAAAAASLIAVGSAAALVPALRAARTDPALVLREQ